MVCGSELDSEFYAYVLFLLELSNTSVKEETM